LNSAEKKALFLFVGIYTFSSILLLTIIAYLYYNKEIDSQKRACKVDLQNAIIQIESKLLKAKLHDKAFLFTPKAYPLGIGLYDKNQKSLYSSLTHTQVDFTQKMTQEPTFVHLVQKLDSPLFGIAYIVSEDIRMPVEKQNLLRLILIVIFFSFIFIAFIGYLLSHLLLKPVKEKISHIDRFIKDSAHEINTPIASLLMSVSALKKKRTLDTKILNHISVSSKQISDVYNSLSFLAFDDIEIEKSAVRVDYKALVERSIEFYKEIAKAKQMTIYAKLEPCIIMIDKHDGKTLINNLLSNAVKYNKIGKTITVTLTAHRLQVSDEGIGISRNQKKSILKRYYRGTEFAGGFGIGLDIINSVSRRYNLTLDIISKKGEGSTFSLDLTSIALIT